MERFSGLQLSGKLLPMKSGILVFEIRNSAQGPLTIGIGTQVLLTKNRESR